MAMMNASIYDVFQAIDRTHAPFKVNTHARRANLDAAVAQAAYRVLSDTYGEQSGDIGRHSSDATRRDCPQPGKNGGINLGDASAQHYVNAHANDGYNLPDAYTPTDGPGHWSTDPIVSPAVQKGWGSDWGSVTPWAMPNRDHFDAAGRHCRPMTARNTSMHSTK